MPAKNLHRKDDKGIYSHIYNKGIEKRIIFNDEEDYAVFQGFLKDYLTTPKDPESIKKAFTVHGQVFRGTPHQPKNYFNKVELIAYNLMPDHFHLLLHQKTHGSLESFIRSLCTRYSMYFNKKYQRTGALFEGPYKSVSIDIEPHLSHLSRYLHHTGGYTSYPEYLGSRVTSWVKPNAILSAFDSGTTEYKAFVEKYGLDQNEKALLDNLTFESDNQHLERRDHTRNEKIQTNPDLQTRSNVPDILAISTALFVLLVTLGIGNIKLSEIKLPQPVSPPTVLGKAEEVKTKPIETKAATSEAQPAATPSAIPDSMPEATSGAASKTTVTVKLNNATKTINIRQKPTINSMRIAKARNGDTFEFVSINSGWYEVKMANGSTGFISATSVVMEETNK